MEKVTGSSPVRSTICISRYTEMVSGLLFYKNRPRGNADDDRSIRLTLRHRQSHGANAIHLRPSWARFSVLGNRRGERRLCVQGEFDRLLGMGPGGLRAGIDDEPVGADDQPAP